MPNLEARYRPGGRPAAVLWSRPVLVDRDWTLGQAAAAPEPYRSDWGVDEPGVDDDHRAALSARHVTLRWVEGRQWLVVAPRVPPPRTPVVRLDTGKEEAAPFTVRPGQGFAIADFEFTLVAHASPGTPRTPVDRAGPPERTLEFNPADDRTAGRFVNPAALVTVLRRVIEECDLLPDDAAFAGVVLQALLEAIPAAGGAAMIAVPDPAGGDPVSQYWAAKAGGPVAFSRRQARHVAATGRGLVSTRSGAGGGGGGTESPVTDWGVYAPVEVAAGRGLVAYVCGRLWDQAGSDPDLAGHPALAAAREAAGLVAGVYAALRRVRRQQAEIQELVQFLPAPVRVLAGRGPLAGVLEPRVVPVTVLFCDLRGSCALAEGGAGDLTRYWWEVLHKALDLMAEAVVQHGGVIGSFLGDAVMAFWGWPDATDDQTERAVRAACGIWWAFDREREKGTPVGGLGFGIGIAHGDAFAGRLGTPVQRKVDVIGPTVNLSARLEGLTKAFKLPVLMDAAAVGRLPPAVRERTRRVGHVAPYGIGEPVEVFGLHTRPTDPTDPPTLAVCRRYEEALALFEAGQWGSARALLQAIPADGPAAFLAALIRDRASPPPEWPRNPAGECAIRMSEK